MKSIDIEIRNSEQLVDITEKVRDYIKEAGLKNGFVHLQIPERTSAVTISINDDWRLEKELFKKLNHLMPKYDGMMFTGWTTANVKASIVGLTLQVMVEKGTLILDKNQSIYFLEFQGPGQRQCFMSTMGTTLDKGEEPSAPECLEVRHKNRSDLKAEHERIQEEMRNEWQLKEERRLEAERKKK
ncbi:MAG: secondary thiamine-phosphate synthase enzyme YjbQ [Acetobacterium sp.]